MIRLIVALDAKRGIAKDGIQPWNLPSELRYFKEVTQQHGGVVIMGRKTWEVIGHPLAGRTNIVVSRHSLAKTLGVTVIHDLQKYLATLQTDAWVIGGTEIFQQTLPIASELYVTEINHDFGCDQFFPEYKQRFRLTNKSSVHEEKGLTFTYSIYKESTGGWDPVDSLKNI